VIAGDLTVLAAASLTDAFEAIGEAFEAANPDVSVTFVFAASSELATQIREGAPADVFASADERTMEIVVDADAVAGHPRVFATNTLAIIVEAGNPLGIVDLADLTDPELIVVSCDPSVPIGAYTQQVLDAAAVEIPFDSYEENVRSVAAKVELGEADAGIVYASDVTAAGRAAAGVAIPPELNVLAEYPIAVTAEAANPVAAEAFSEFVLGAGQELLTEHGFGEADGAPIASAPAPTASAPASSSPGGTTAETTGA
jgi:molybdate transport system substrate-binding protein